MAQPQRSARSVFVGNIPYDATEEQLTEVFSEVGPVVSFRLVFDRDTGKPKGYGFCEYRDAETALSAMRNLNNREFSTRNLRVDFAESEKASMQALAAQSNALGPNKKANMPNYSQAPPNIESIAQMIAEMQPHTTYDVVAKMKMLIQQHPNEVRQLLLSSPPLTHALLQAQVKLGMINTAAMQRLVARASSTPSMPNPMGSATVPNPGMPMTGGMGQPMGMPMGGNMGGRPMNMMPVPSGMPQPMGNMPMMSGPGQFPAKMTGFPTNPVQPGPHASYPASQPTPEQQAELIQRIMHLTPAQIDELPLEAREQILSLKQQLGLSNFGPM
eukprot:TRINITY_DN6882_c0_g1_i1.p1 TRINITY_DN6882_c0_g1~~TRINITY_DN6882_c0_g1_i1.p1  ORF type:complete len:329 (+),score=56.82 TRINITY_DN6882_c0_g1_i1:26-1012(+)